MSKDGLTIDLERTRAIISLSLPSHKKVLQSFLLRIDVVKRFIPNLATMVKPLTAMLKKNMVFSWTKEGNFFFKRSKNS